MKPSKIVDESAGIYLSSVKDNVLGLCTGKE